MGESKRALRSLEEQEEQENTASLTFSTISGNQEFPKTNYAVEEAMRNKLLYASEVVSQAPYRINHFFMP